MTATLVAPARVDAPQVKIPKKQKRTGKSTSTHPRHPPSPGNGWVDTSIEQGIDKQTLSPVQEEFPNSDFVNPYFIVTGRTNLPTFPWEDGYRIITNPTTGEQHEVPLTLYDTLYETEDDIGAVFMSQNAEHATLSSLLVTMLTAYFPGWLFLYDVYVRWGFPGIRPKAPDLIAVPGGQMPPKGQKSFVIGRDGPIPAFIVEITSESTRSNDLTTKKEFYASMGVREYLIIDTLPEEGSDWQLIGYRLGDEPHYQPLPTDAEGGILFETIGLRFVPIGSSDIHVFHHLTGERLLSATELKALAEREQQEKERYKTYLRSIGIDPDTI